MAKWSLDANMDAMLANIADNGTRIDVCSGQPANYAGIAAVTLAHGTLTAGDGNGDYTIGDGDSSGRKLTVAEQALTADGSNDATHIALSNGSDTLLYVTTCTTQTITSGNPVTVPAWDIEVADPT